MKHNEKIITIGLITVLIIGGLGAYLYTSRLNQSKLESQLIESRAVKEKEEKLEERVTPKIEVDTIIKKGSFNYLDPAHYASGSVTISQKSDDIRIKFSENFKTNPDGPDLYVWLVKKQNLKNIAIAGVSSSKNDYLDLGAIQSKTGSQTYQVTKSEFEKFDYAVVIWCRAFGVQFSNAPLE